MFANRLLTHLAVANDHLTTIAASAERYGISKNHLIKVTQNLVQLSYIKAVRGRAGGLRLATDASAINVGEIAKSMGTDATFVMYLPTGTGSVASHRPAD